MSHSDRLKRQQVRQIIREAEGYLDLIMSLADHWPLRADVRDQVAQRAVTALSRLKDAGSDQAKVHYLLGQAYRVMECYDLAVHPLEQSATIDPTNIHVHLALGWCYKRTGRLDLAIEALEAAQANEPDEAIVYYNLACYWSLARNKQNALDYLSRAISMDANYRDLIHHESDFDGIRDDPDFQALTAVIV